MALDEGDVDLSDLALVGADGAGGDTEDEDDDDTPQYWFVLVPADGSPPQLVCLTSAEQLEKDYDLSASQTWSQRGLNRKRLHEQDGAP